MSTIKKVISVVLTVLMLVGVFSVATPVFAAEVTNATTEAVSESVAEAEISTTAEETETAEATEKNEQVTIQNEIEELRNETTKYFRQSDGTILAAKYAEPVHYEKNGKWEEIDNTLTEEATPAENSLFSIFENNEKKFVAENRKNPVSFPGEFKKNGENKISVSVEGYEISFAPKSEQSGIKASAAEIKETTDLQSNELSQNSLAEKASATDNSKNKKEKLQIANVKSAIIYEDVFSNIDLEYELTSAHLKESIVLEKKQDKNTFEFSIDLGGLYPQAKEDGSIALCSDAECKSIVAVIAAPYMEDSAGAYSQAVTMALIPQENQYILTVTADKAWLDAEERHYPVIIDPTIELEVGRAKTYECYVDTSSPNTAFGYDDFIYAGNSSLGKTRTFVKIDLPDLPDNNSIITNATINFYQYQIDMNSGTENYLSLHKVTSDWDNVNRNITWNNQPSFESGTVIDYSKFEFNESATTAHAYQFDITRLVKEWYNSTTPNYGVALKAVDETVISRTRMFSAEETTNDLYPRIFVTFKNNKGLEDIWSYSSYSIGSAGTANINDYTGNLVYIMPLLSSISEIMPLNLSAVFNNYCATQKLNVGKGASSRTTVAKGFRLNIQETVLPSSDYGLTGDAAETYPYVYTDGDGTEHYIQKVTKDGATTYKDEDGLGYTLTTGHDDCTYKITDKADNTKSFNSKGNLIKIADANGNDIYIYYKAANTAIGLEAKSRISHITDGAGRKFTFAYYTDTDGAEMDYIKTITDTAGREITFTTKGGHLRSVKYPDGTVTRLAYEFENSSTDDYEEAAEGLINYILSDEGYGINFDYTSKATGRRVKNAREFGTNSAGEFTRGQMATFDRTKYNTTVIRSSGMDGCHPFHYSTAADIEAYGADDIITTLQFDNAGRTVSQQLRYGSGSFIGAGSYAYTSTADDTSTLGSKNKVSATGSVGKNTVNLLTGGNGESTTGWTMHVSDENDITSQKTASTAQQYMSKSSLRIYNSAIGENTANSYYRQNVSGVAQNSKYTLSAYVKTSGITAVHNVALSGAYIQVTSYNSAGTAIETVRSEILKADTDEAVNNGWRRLYATIETDSNTASLRVYLCFKDYTGYAYFDCIQLEAGQTANTFNMLENSSFEKASSGLPTSWSVKNIEYTASGGTVYEGITTETDANGSQSVRVEGEIGTEKHIYQRVNIVGTAKDTYIVSGWGGGKPVNSTYHYIQTEGEATETTTDDKYEETALFEICPEVKYTKTDSSGNETTVYQEKPAAKFNTTVTGWQYTSTPFSLKYTGDESGCKYTPIQITIILKYYNQANAVYFDNIMLTKEPAPTYTYDKEGNLVSASANAEQTTNAVYNETTNDLTSYTDTLGNATTMVYNNYHQLLRSKSAKGVYSANGYNDNGTYRASETRNAETSAGSSLIIRTNQTYYEDDASTTSFKENAFVKSVYDEHGNAAATYTYNFATGVPLTVTDANGTVTTNTYNSNKTRLTAVTTGSSKVSYTYSGNRISSILFGTTASGEEYSFEYDSYGNRTKTKVGDVALSTNAYNINNGALSLTTYGNGDKIRYGYDNLGNRNYVYHNDNTNWSYYWRYDASGTPLMHRDNQNDRKYIYSYDSLGRLVREEIRSDNADEHLGYVEQGYDLRNNINKLTLSIGGRTVKQAYLYSAYSKTDSSGNAIANSSASYAKDNLPTLYQISSTRYAYYDYDSINRLASRTLTTGRPIYNTYTYKLSQRNAEDSITYRTNQLGLEIVDNTAYRYYYDNVGNITEIKKGERDTSVSANTTETKNYSNYKSYTYDALGQLRRENNASTNTTSAWNYDTLGNIESVITYDYTTGDLGNLETGIDYQYTDDGKSGWSRLLTTLVYKTYTYDAEGNRTTTVNDTKTITYDNIGNPVNYLGANLTWRGRQLKKYVDGSTTVSYLYDANGLRGSKTVNGVKSTYTYVGDKLVYESRSDGKEFYFFYDSYNNLTAIRYISGSTDNYYYVTTNLQGDVLGIYTGGGVLLASYEYDAWGNCTVTSHNANFTIGEDNPIRYRGYYYDSETGLYYLQSRYYDPEIGRFINADGYVTTGQGVLSYNMFAYCSNSPVMYSDPSGCLPEWAKKIISWVINNVISIMKKSKSPGIRVAGEFLGAIKGGYDTGKSINAIENPITKSNEIKEKYVDDIYDVGKNKKPVTETPCQSIFPDVYKYNQQCLEMFDSLSNNPKYSNCTGSDFDKVEARNTIISWDYATCFQLCENTIVVTFTETMVSVMEVIYG